MKTTMPAPLALYLAKATLAAVSTDDVTPVITGVHLARHGKALRATATDRYRVHEVTLEAATTHGKADESVLLPSSAFRWIQRAMRIIAPRKSDRVSTTVTISTRISDQLTRALLTINTADGDSMTLDTATIKGNFPPVYRLIDAAVDAPRYAGDVRLNTYFLGKLAAIMPDSDGSYAPVLKQTAMQRDGEPIDKPGALYAVATADGITARALIQPNLLLR